MKLMAATLRYFAYGSNLHPERLRVRVPSARFLKTAELHRYELRLHKRGMDDSAKCDAFYTGHEDARVYGAIYEIDAQHKADLDLYEDQGRGYLWTPLPVMTATGPEEVYSYLATGGFIDDSLRPYDWYQEIVLIGMRYHGHPADYIRHAAGIETISDPNVERATKNHQLIKRLRFLAT